MSDQEECFEAAQAATRSLRARPDNDTLVEPYSCFKQATKSEFSDTRLGAFDFAARAKYDAWEAREGVRKVASMRAHVKLVEHLRSLES